MNDQSQLMNQKPQPPQMMTQQPPQMMTHRPQMMMMSQQPPQQPPMMTQRSYGMWPPPVPPMTYPNPMNPPQGGFVKPRNWKGKKGIDKRRIDNSVSGAGYRPPTLNELQHQNRVKARRFFNPKKKSNYRFAPYAPRNTTSFLIRAKKSGGIASLVSPCPVTPAVLPTPMFSPSREVLGDMAKEEWGVDGYGSMKGLIRLRSPGGDHEGDDDESSSDSDVEEHVEVERRLDHDLSRFEMIYPSYGGVDYNNVLENRVDDQDTHIAHLEEENLILKERLFLMEREMGDLRRRMQYLERNNNNNNHVGDEINEEVVDNVSENDSESRDDGHFMDHEGNRDEGDEVDGKEHGSSYSAPEDDEFVTENQSKVNADVSMEGATNVQVGVAEEKGESKKEGEGNTSVERCSGISDDVAMEGVTGVQVGVAKEADESKIVEDKTES